MAANDGPWRAPTDTAPAETGQSERSGRGGQGDQSGGPAGPLPENIRIAWVLWLAATAFGVVGMVLNVLTTTLGDLPDATREAIRDAAADAGESAPSLDALFTGAMWVGAGLAVLVAVVTAWLAFRLRAGKGWARTMLDIVAIFLMVDAVSVVVGVFGDAVETGSRGEVVTFIVMACQILAGLCAATAVWRQHTAEAMEFTRGGQRADD